MASCPVPDAYDDELVGVELHSEGCVLSPREVVVVPVLDDPRVEMDSPCPWHGRNSYRLTWSTFEALASRQQPHSADSHASADTCRERQCERFRKDQRRELEDHAREEKPEAEKGDDVGDPLDSLIAVRRRRLDPESEPAIELHRRVERQDVPDEA